MKILRRRMVIVGDTSVGKTCLLTVIARGVFPTYTACIYGGHVEEIVVDGNMVHLGFWDTAGGEEHDRLRPLNYPDSSVVLLCFAIDDHTSLLNITRRWYPEIMAFRSVPKVPILLVGCKADLRDNVRERAAAVHSPRGLITTEEGHATAKAIGAVKYMECSALLGQGTREVILEAGQLAGSWTPTLYGRCSGTCRPF
ncbi:hypothetical protein M408DRAFT_330060 [Serendipita vermifera MAFF 305830]|uniref:Uncharacterized protein n=1 Tax=Serendipita vermifera MAFF 305830 TaxID=933852 RepID=A0A0C2WM12_SERVB|nr:hypothetical protein M408DRAFT_330060 [Serendipita vermifera MAFF 305830]